jgi:hypothetical protein
MVWAGEGNPHSIARGQGLLMEEEVAEQLLKILIIQKRLVDAANFSLKVMGHLIHFKHLRGLVEESY